MRSAQIPKVQKDSQVNSVFFAHLGSMRAKAACKTLVKSIPEDGHATEQRHVEAHFLHSLKKCRNKKKFFQTLLNHYLS